MGTQQGRKVGKRGGSRGLWDRDRTSPPDDPRREIGFGKDGERDAEPVSSVTLPSNQNQHLCYYNKEKRRTVVKGVNSEGGPGLNNSK